jgi:tetratricopeptide (TPR) repeat protein
MVSHDYLAAIYPTFGRYDQAVEEAKKTIGLAPDFAIGYAPLAMKYQFLDLLEEATNTLQQASGRKLEIPDFLVQRYDIAFLKSDKAEMQ